MGALPDIARATAAAYGMFPDGAAVLAMVSGGADSTALLRLLAADEIGAHAGRLAVLHVNHRLRGAESDADEEFVVAMCARLGVECRVVRSDIAGYAAAEGLNLEDAGRRIRYSLAGLELDALCERCDTSRELGRIAVAHTLDDRIETFLARIVTGAGSGGLKSIPPVRGRLVRPLIDARRADVVGYLTGLGQDWREDASNTDTSRERAWVRHELLPSIEARVPAFASNAARTMRLLAEEDELLSEMAAALAGDMTESADGVLFFDRSRMSALSRPMARRTVRSALLAAFPEASRLELEHFEALVDGLALDRFARDLPFGLRAEVEYGRLGVSRKSSAQPRVVPGSLDLPGFADLGAAGSIEAQEVAPDSPVSAGDAVCIDADSVTWPLTVDQVREGDRIWPLGMEGTKKVGDLLTDARVPRRLRGATPVLRDGDRVVWVAGVRLAEDVRLTGETTSAARIVWHRPPTTDEIATDYELEEGR